MAVQSERTELGTPVPDVTLEDLDGDRVNVPGHAGERGLLVVFAANHCPYVRHVEAELARLAGELQQLGITTLAIGSNDVDSYPADGPEGMREQALRAGWEFPYLRDESQDAARAFGAVCTPDFFLFDADGALAFRGGMDASTPKNGQPLTGDSLRAAAHLVAEGKPVPEPQQPAMGCGLKWRDA